MKRSPESLSYWQDMDNLRTKIQKNPDLMHEFQKNPAKVFLEYDLDVEVEVANGKRRMLSECLLELKDVDKEKAAKEFLAMKQNSKPGDTSFSWLCGVLVGFYVVAVAKVVAVAASVVAAAHVGVVANAAAVVNAVTVTDGGGNPTPSISGIGGGGNGGGDNGGNGGNGGGDNESRIIQDGSIGTNINGFGNVINGSGTSINGSGGNTVSGSGTSIDGIGTNINGFGNVVKGSGTAVSGIGGNTVSGSGTSIDGIGTNINGFGNVINGSGASVKVSGVNLTKVSGIGKRISGTGVSTRASGVNLSRVSGTGKRISGTGISIKVSGTNLTKISGVGKRISGTELNNSITAIIFNILPTVISSLSQQLSVFGINLSVERINTLLQQAALHPDTIISVIKSGTIQTVTAAYTYNNAVKLTLTININGKNYTISAATAERI